MRSAPSVTYPVGRSAFQGLLLLGLGLSGALALVLWWWLSSAPTAWTLGLGVSGWLVWTLAALRVWRNTPIGVLQWDAHSPGDPSLDRSDGWCWLPADGGPQALEAVLWVLDAQSVVLLRLHRTEGRALWVWLEGAHEAARWHDLRRALTAHAL